MRTITLIAMLLVVVSASAMANTPWEKYVLAPSPAAAAAVQKAEYSTPDENNRRFESDLPVLENEVASGDGESAKLAERLRAQYGTAAAILEYLDALLGRSIRPNPAGYLRAIADSRGCPGALPSGDLFTDRMEARAAEARAREAALRNVKDPMLQKKRDECVAILRQVR